MNFKERPKNILIDYKIHRLVKIEAAKSCKTIKNFIEKILTEAIFNEKRKNA